MAHADDATKTWVSATPKKNADGNVVQWKVQYKYTKAELLTLMDKDHWDDMFNKKYTTWTADAVVETTDASFDVSTLSDS